METMDTQAFLPVTLAEAKARGWHEVDFVLACGDAYVDHPSFGAAVLGRVLEAAGYRVGMLPQPAFKGPAAIGAFQTFGRPRLAFLVSGGVVDSMVAHYTVAKRRRTFDEYSPGGAVGKRPDRVVDVYAKLAKSAYPGVPVVVGGVEASLRRFAHYDYWDDAVLPSILQTSGADLVSFGMGERSLVEIARRLSAGEGIDTVTNVPGTACLTGFDSLPATYAECAAYAKVKADKTAYAKACRIQMDNQDPIAAKPVVQRQEKLYLVQNPPATPLERAELDELYKLPFTRRWHPMYDQQGGVPALEEVKFSIIHNRGCFGGCAYCAITLHQGRRVTSRSAGSVVEEATRLARDPDFKGYIHDVGGPTANFREASCQKQLEKGGCTGGKRCLAPTPCPNLRVDHSEYLDILRRVRAVNGVKKVFIRSGIRFDYVLADKNEDFFRELVAHHVSGQLKVAPEHCSPGVLRAMGKPSIETYNRFAKRFYQLTKQCGKEQYLVPYLISSHPGSTLKDAVALALWLRDNHIRPEQVQDFYPTPGTVSTCMYYTGLDPYTLKPVYVARDPEEKAMQRALLQPHLPQNRTLARKALNKAGRADLIPVLVGGPARPAARQGAKPKTAGGRTQNKTGGKNPNWHEKRQNNAKKKRK
ncbi:YgiQ family radical SAM protein [Clostridia bacterium OttesenSCG-928-O13]|nr:YgiQ family radical SAM protein [Clostridia bacterium OttesenSCG-928-O13]